MNDKYMIDTDVMHAESQALYREGVARTDEMHAESQALYREGVARTDEMVMESDAQRRALTKNLTIDLKLL
jgi:hypothetical protein